MRRIGLMIGLSTLLMILSACSSDVSDEKLVLDRGEDLYSLYCNVCHGDAATGEGAVGDAPTHDPNGHTWHHADGQLVDIILGRLEFPGRTMPGFADSLSESDVVSILDYLKEGWKPDQREYQAEVSRNWEQVN